MFCCQMDDFENREGVNFSDSPLKVKLLEKIGLRPFLINQFVFPRPRPSTFFMTQSTILRNQMESSIYLSGNRDIYLLLDLMNPFIF